MLLTALPGYTISQVSDSRTKFHCLFLSQHNIKNSLALHRAITSFIGLCSCTCICYLRDWHLFIRMQSLKVLEHFWPLKPSFTHGDWITGAQSLERTRFSSLRGTPLLITPSGNLLLFFLGHISGSSREARTISHTFSDSQETYLHAILRPYIRGKAKAIPLTGRGGPQGCETSRLPHFF
jgi:hypothetical protein